MSLQDQARIGGVLALAVILALILARNHLGRLNAASWLVVLGAVVIAGEHAQFAISYTVPFTFITIEGPMRLMPHARLHFFMAGIYTNIGLVLLCVIARTLLKEGRRSGWYALLFALLVGGGLTSSWEGGGFRTVRRSINCSASRYRGLAGNSCMPTRLRGSRRW